MKTITISLSLTFLLAWSASAGDAAESKLAKDRKAILAMAGDFLVTFEFEETFSLHEDYKLRKPYREYASETVKVMIDKPHHISLQHILLDEDTGRIVKHWKQEWIYEDTEISKYEGGQTWTVENISKKEAKGTWSQRVYQVDDTPRYESYGKWVHEGGVSQWTSKLTRRPLPRREHTKRDDYEVMMAVNRHTLTPRGWMHEQDNYKQVSVDGPILCREIGLNEYEYTTDVDFSTVNEFWEKTEEFWHHLTAKWNDELSDGHLAIKNDEEVEGQPRFRRIFSLAKQVKEGELEGAAMEQAVDELVDAFASPENRKET
ncbi:MAG: DUF6607 family protein [Verrucomicrobiota bacterium]